MSDDWRDRAACLGVDPDVFFPPQGNSAAEAKSYCQGCEVVQKCLDEHLWEPRGIFGNTTPSERRIVRQQRGLTTPPPKINHGTNAGYYQHKRQGLPACVPCRIAHAADRQERKRLRLVRDGAA